MDESPRVNRPVFALLYAISILYLLFALTAQLVHRLNTLGEFPISLTTESVLFLPLVVQIALFGVLIYAGLWLGKSVGLGAPLLGGWAEGRPVREQAVSALKMALLVGLGVTALKYLLDFLVFAPFVPATLSQWRWAPLFLKLPIPFQQGIGDEIVYRLFGITAVVWIIWKITGSGDPPLKDWLYWAGLLVAALVPVITVAVAGVSGLVLLQYAAIILAGAIPFGWLYWKKGIESAIVAHVISSVALVLLSLG
jgi:hypothetical protein